MERLVIGADHAGFRLKERLSEFLKEKGYQLVDVGCYNEESVDYPGVGQKLAETMQSQGIAKGVICCGSGIGVCMSVNRFPWVRGVLAHEHNSAVMSRRHNDANVICFGGRVIAPELAADILNTWLETPFDGGRHQNRVDMMTSLHTESQDNRSESGKVLPSC